MKKKYRNGVIEEVICAIKEGFFLSWEILSYVVSAGNNPADKKSVMPKRKELLGMCLIFQIRKGFFRSPPTKHENAFYNILKGTWPCRLC